MIGELYNWEQLRAYSIVALNNILESNEKINLGNFIRELDTLQSLYGKEGITGLAKRHLNNNKK